MPDYSLLKKISVKTVVGRVERPEKDKRVLLMQIIGVAIGTSTGVSSYGPWVALKGQFMAVDFATKKQYRSGKCHLPEEALSEVLVELACDNVDSVEFSYDIYARGNATAIGYEYEIVPLLPVKENDAIALLAHKVDEHNKPTKQKEGK